MSSSVDVEEYKRFLLGREFTSKYVFNIHYSNMPDLPVLRMHCNSDECSVDQNFDGIRLVTKQDSMNIFKDIRSCQIATYKCRNCEEHVFMIFRLGYSKNEKGESQLVAIKIAQDPIPNNRIVQPVTEFLYGTSDWSLYLKAAKLEEQGYGIAAMAYLRRVVNNTWDRLIDEMLLFAEDPKVIASLKQSKGAWQFEKAVDPVKLYIPSSFMIEGENPLVLMYNAFSGGLHSYSEERCLEVAKNARTVFERTLTNLEHLKKEKKEIKAAVSYLKKSHKSKK